MELADKMLKALQQRTVDLAEEGKVEGSHGIITQNPNAAVRPRKKIQPKEPVIDAEIIEKATPLRASAPMEDSVTRVAARLAESRLQYRSRRERNIPQQRKESDSLSEPFERKPSQPKEKRGRSRRETGIADDILSMLESEKKAALLKYSISNIDEILDEDDTMTDEVWEALYDNASKEQLLSYLELALATLR